MKIQICLFGYSLWSSSKKTNKKPQMWVQKGVPFSHMKPLESHTPIRFPIESCQISIKIIEQKSLGIPAPSTSNFSNFSIFRFNLASVYLTGSGTEQSFQKATQWCAVMNKTLDGWWWGIGLARMLGKSTPTNLSTSINIYRPTTTQSFFSSKNIVLPWSYPRNLWKQNCRNQELTSKTLFFVWDNKNWGPFGPIIFWSSTLIFNNHSIWEMGMVKMDRFHGQHRDRVSGDVPFDQSMDSWKIHIASQSCPPYI